MSKRIKPEPETPIEIIDLDQSLEQEALTPSERESGASFWFGHVGVIALGNGTKYHIQKHRAFITDPELIANLKEAAKNPSNYITVE